MNVLQKWVSITAWLDTIYFFMIPAIMLYTGMSWGYALVAGVCLGAYQPTVTSYHELHHRKKSMRWFEKIPFYFGFSSYLLGIIDIVHREFHHKHANTKEDISHPMRDMNYYQNAFNYYFRYLHLTFNKNRLQVGGSILGFILLGIFQYCVFGPAGLAFQIATTLAHHWTVSCGNYCQHWGLEELNLPKAEKALHAWDNRGEFARYSFFNFHRHSGHHANAGTPAQDIVDNRDMIKNPYPLPLMMFMAHFPCLFRKVSAPRLEKYLVKHKTK